MNILKLNSGKVEVRKDSGTLIRNIGNADAVFADFNASPKLLNPKTFYISNKSSSTCSLVNNFIISFATSIVH